MNKGRAIKVTKVFESAPGDQGGLEVGDEIFKIGAMPFPKRGDAIYFLVDGIEQATTAKRSVLAITVRRMGREKVLKIPFPSLGKHAKSCPKKCKRCGRMVAQSLRWLANGQRGDGSWDSKAPGSGNRVVAITAFPNMSSRCVEGNGQ